MGPDWLNLICRSIDNLDSKTDVWWIKLFIVEGEFGEIAAVIQWIRPIFFKTVAYLPKMNDVMILINDVVLFLFQLYILSF